ncbi:hypothetical protein Lalb_Chr11g0072191 [Lupinus albus]|uniref:Uncharacterized protein n=1 Tax=Lupinus albus TaxID=3870 RepID=A0A6A4PSF0_LUPAL|nr:hypothetical protein Lalb_Chr11g0072191 [Lupinus albus]
MQRKQLCRGDNDEEATTRDSNIETHKRQREALGFLTSHVFYLHCVCCSLLC